MSDMQMPDGTKSWYQSRTVLVLVVALLAEGAHKTYGVSVDAALQSDTVNAILQIITDASTILGIFFRIKATAQIAPTPKT